MFGRKTFYGIQFFISILGISSNALRPGHTERVLNTENIILLMKDFDENNIDDLEIIKDFPESFALFKKLRNFHRLIREMRATEKARQNQEVWPAKSIDSFSPDLTYRNAVKQGMRRNRKKKRRPTKYGAKGRRGIRVKRSLQRSPFTISTERDLEQLYEDFVADCLRNNKAYKYTDKGKPEENIYDAINKIMEQNFPENCINITGVGLDAIKCLLTDIKKGKINNEDLINKVTAISFVWIPIYLAIALTFWCALGWCCCCFRCSVCFPNKTIRSIKNYLRENPPGFYRDSQGRVERYHASEREKELYEILTKSVEQY